MVRRLSAGGKWIRTNGSAKVQLKSGAAGFEEIANFLSNLRSNDARLRDREVEAATRWAGINMSGACPRWPLGAARLRSSSARS